jgi:hypothetical protein
MYTPGEEQYETDYNEFTAADRWTPARNLFRREAKISFSEVSDENRLYTIEEPAMNRKTVTSELNYN